MKKFFLPVFILSFYLISSAQNPLTPAGVYFPDPSAKVFNGKLYIYGSLDESDDYWCSKRHHVIETSDLKTWIIHEDVFSSVGEKDEVSYNNELLFAPDCGFRNDTFYLYYCQPSSTQAEGVAVSTSPAGPFVNGQLLNVGKYQEIDPSIFTDSDGQAYYLWGQFSLKMARMKESMREIDTSSIKVDVLTEKQHFFHEGAFMTKRKDLYYLIFADISRGEKPTCLGYATSKTPMGPYTYRGVIIDNDECHPGTWNNHGSVVEFRDQWYVFYHRNSHGSDKMRRICAEPIFFNEDGTIDEVEMTSQGISGPIPAFQKVEAEQACILHGNLKIQSFSPYQEELTQINNGDKALYRYIDFTGEEKKLVLRLAPGKTSCDISVNIDKPWHRKIAGLSVEAGEGEKMWQTVSVDIEKLKGAHGLYFQFHGSEGDLVSLDWFRFE